MVHNLIVKILIKLIFYKVLLKKNKLIISINNNKLINENIYKDWNNTIINFDSKIDVDYEIMLIITAEFDTMESDFNNFN